MSYTLNTTKVEGERERERGVGGGEERAINQEHNRSAILSTHSQASFPLCSSHARDLWTLS